jgi:hypothetical protein
VTSLADRRVRSSLVPEAAPTHWQQWHRAYDDPSSPLSRRLAVVQRWVGRVLDEAPAGAVTVVSMCAGRGHDVIDVVRDHPRRADVRARLVELDPVLAADAAAAAHAHGLTGVEVLNGDAATTDAYAGGVPADLILVCGVFGNVAESDIRRTVDELASLAAPGATVIWTRHRRPPDLTPTVRAWFRAAGFDEVAWETAPDAAFGVGVSRLTAPPRPFGPGRRLFSFVGDGAAANR